MPFPLLAAAIPAVASVAGSVINSISNSNANSKSQAFALDMYNREKADNQRLWEQTNAYNSPQAQMARLAEAGLNPNLVYGNGSVASTAAPMKAPNAPSVQFRASEPGNGLMSMGNLLGMYQDFQLRQAQTDNARAQTEILAQQAQGLKLDNLYKESSMGDRLTTLMYNKNLVGNKNIETSQRINYLKDMYPMNLKDMTFKMANDALIPGYTKAGTQLRLQQVDFNMLEKQLNSMGISRKDPVMWRIGATLLQNLFPNFKLNK